MAFGPHVTRDFAGGVRPPITDHIRVAVAAARAEAGFDITALAVFVGGPYRREITLHEDERAPLREFIRSTHTRVFAHSAYSAQPWRGDPSAVRYIREEQRVCAEAGIEGLVVHLPKLPVERVMQYAARLLDPAAPGVRLYLETPAVQPRESYWETPAKLVALFRELRTVDPDLARFGLCVDTAHLSTCGVDLSTYGAADAWLKALEAGAGVIPHGSVLLHLNDSLRPRGAGPDAHAALTTGTIWGAFRGDLLGESGLAAFVDYARRHDTPAILERKPLEALRGDYLILRALAPTSGRAP